MTEKAYSEAHKILAAKREITLRLEKIRHITDNNQKYNYSQLSFCNDDDSVIFLDLEVPYDDCLFQYKILEIVKEYYQKLLSKLEKEFEEL